VAEPAASAAAADLATFAVRGRVYALEVAPIREIVRARPVTALPGAPPLVEGVAELRGRVVPVVDLGRVLEGEPVPEDPQPRIVLVQVDDLLLGLRVDAALDVLPAGSVTLEPLPAVTGGTGRAAVRAVVRRPEEGPLPVLSLEGLVGTITRSGDPASAGRASPGPASDGRASAGPASDGRVSAGPDGATPAASEGAAS